MRYHVRLLVNEHQHLHTAAKMHTGLNILKSQGIISFQLRFSDAPYTRQAVTLILGVEAIASKQRRVIAFDLRDRSDVFTEEALKKCDVYFKRGYYSHDVKSVPDCAKILPFGLNHCCTTAQSKKHVLRVLMPHYMRLSLRSPRQFWPALSSYLHNVYEYASTADMATFEQGPTISVDPLIIFQPRLYAPEDAIENWQEVNTQRAAVVRALKEEFGEQFLGGLEPSDYARTQYPELITSHPTRHSQYILAARRGLIGVYTRGLHHSLAFKLAEYLASSKCIVSEPLRHELPAPLLPGKNYLEFQSPDECVQQCRHLLQNQELAAAMRRANSAYYQEQVNPATHMLSCLDRAFATA